jgi:hypothetical protein
METRTKQVAHTPGPWDAVSSAGLLRDVEAVGHIGVAGAMGRTREEQEANARLIAAAPELLAIVRRFVALPSGAWHPERHAAEEAELIREARSTIARATPTTEEGSDV